MSQYGTTYGIGLIHNRLALLSSWNTVIATFNHGVFEHRVFSITNGLVLYLLLLQIVVLLKRLSSIHREKSYSYLLIILGSVLMISFLSFCNPAYEYFYCKCLFQKRFIILWKRIIILNWNKTNKNRAKFWFFYPT